MGDMADSIEHMECWIGADLDEDDMPETASDEPVAKLIERLRDDKPLPWRYVEEAASRLAALQQRVDELEGAAQFDKAIFAGECSLTQKAVTRALAAEAQLATMQQRVDELERRHETLAQRYPEVLAAHAQFGGDLKDMLRRYEDNSALRAAQRQIDRNGS